MASTGEHTATVSYLSQTGIHSQVVYGGPASRHTAMRTLALVRAIDRLDLSAVELPQQLLHELFELDADFAEALWALGQPPNALDYRAMVRDTLASLKRRPEVLEEFLARLPARAIQPLAAYRAAIRAALACADAYYETPGHEEH